LAPRYFEWGKPKKNVADLSASWTSQAGKLRRYRSTLSDQQYSYQQPAISFCSPVGQLLAEN